MKMAKKGTVSKRTFWLGVLFSLLLGVVFTVTFLGKVINPNAYALYQMHSLIEKRFVGEYPKEDYANAILYTMVESLGDRWSYFMTEEAYEQVVQNRQNAYVGIGVTIGGEDKSQGIDIIKVQPNSPASVAGIQVGDVVVSVAGESVTEENYQASIDAIRGEIGESITLGIRSPDGLVRSVDVLLDTIETIPVTHSVLENGLGYVRLRNFYAGSGSAFVEAVKDLQAKNVSGIVFDLRDNPGGYVTEMTKMLDYLLPEGVIFRSETLQGEQDNYHSDASSLDLPFAVLVNAESYSAAEFFAGELRESVGAYVVGEQTSGKGFSQQIFRLANGAAVGLSTGTYRTGKGTSFQGVGLVPDSEVTPSDDERRLYLSEVLPPDADSVLQSALQDASWD